MKKIAAMLGAALLTVPHIAAQAHTLWINVVPEYNKHVVASIAYGDVMPGSEIMTPDWGPMTIAAYDVLSPGGTRSALGVPQLVTHDRTTLKSGITVQPGSDTAIRKFGITPETKKGTYVLAGATPLVRLTHYRDAQGKDQYTERPVDEVDGVAEVVGQNFEINLMKAAFSVGGWSEPATAGQALEIVPLSDLDEARTGDVVRFKVLLNGEAWTPAEGEAYITAHNMGFGHRWGLYSSLKYGEGEFRLPQAGMWRVDAAFTGKVSDVEAYRAAAGAEAQNAPLLVESSFTFNVAP